MGAAPDDPNAHPVVLQARGVTKAFGGQAVLAGVDFDLRRGEVVLLRGDNGSGKTTLLNILTGNLEPDAGVLDLRANSRAERLAFPRRWWQKLNPFDHFTPERVAAHGVGRTWQDVRLFAAQDLCGNIEVATPGQLGENPGWAVGRPAAVRRQERANREAALALLRELGLEDRAGSSADRISLGQAKRVAIARAVQAGARVLFLDEPLAGLDGSGVAQVLGLLETLARERGLTLVVVEHVFHIPRLLDRATTVWTLVGGRLRVQGPEEVREELRKAPGVDVRAWLAEAVVPEAACVERQLPGGAVLSTFVPRDRPRGEVLLRAADVVVRRGNRTVVGDEEGRDGAAGGITLELRDGEMTVLQAPNGWGKTTLLEALAGLLPVAAGEILWRGRSLRGVAPWERARLGVSLLQARDHAFPNLTVREALALAGGTGDAAHLAPLLGRKMGQLSGGEKQQVALAVALPAAALRLLDEPFSMLDRGAIARLAGWLRPGPGQATLVALPGALAA